MATRIVLLKHLAGLTWGTLYNVLRTSSLTLIFSPTEYCTAAWCLGFHINTQLYKAMRIITRCIRSTAIEILPCFAGNEPPQYSRDKISQTLEKKSRRSTTPPLYEDELTIYETFLKTQVCIDWHSKKC